MLLTQRIAGCSGSRKQAAHELRLSNNLYQWPTRHRGGLRRRCELTSIPYKFYLLLEHEFAVFHGMDKRLEGDDGTVHEHGCAHWPWWRAFEEFVDQLLVKAGSDT